MVSKKKTAVKLPENYDPYNMDLKRLFHAQADEKNVIGTWNKWPALMCGAKRKGKTCGQIAGTATDHKGYGRCKHHGGRNTGPKTKEGKTITAQNPRKHGLYSSALSKDERETYEQLLEDPAASLLDEIMMMKAKVLLYLQKWNKKLLEKGEEATKRWYQTTDQGRASYYAGTIEDRVLDRALNTLGRLVEKHARLTQSTGDDLLSQINRELRQASQGKVMVSWGGKAQEKTEKE